MLLIIFAVWYTDQVLLFQVKFFFMLLQNTALNFLRR